MAHHEAEEALLCEDDDNDEKPRLCLLFIAEEDTLPPLPPPIPRHYCLSHFSPFERNDDSMTPVVVEVVRQRLWELSK
jgi:hypothetical protein